MNESKIVAEQCLVRIQTRSAMEEGQWNSAVFLAYSCDSMLANASKVLVNDETKLTNTNSFDSFQKKFPMKN